MQILKVKWLNSRTSLNIAVYSTVIISASYLCQLLLLCEENVYVRLVPAEHLKKGLIHYINNDLSC